MTHLTRGLAGLGLLCAIAFAPTARAATPVAALPPLNLVTALLEGYALDRYLAVPNTVNLGMCQAAVTIGFPTVEMRFTKSATCPLNGYLRFGMLPITVSIRLELFNVPLLQAVDGDFVMQVSRQGSGNTTLRWALTNGRFAFRLDPSQPSQERNISGQGVRVRTNRVLTADSRFNFFEPATGSGFAITRHIDAGANVKDTQRCMLIGASASNITSGQLLDCVAMGR